MLNCETSAMFTARLRSGLCAVALSGADTVLCSGAACVVCCRAGGERRLVGGGGQPSGQGGCAAQSQRDPELAGVRLPLWGG